MIRGGQSGRFHRCSSGPHCDRPAILGTRVVVPGYPGSMAMSIKNERVAGKIRELAQLLETDQVTAVERAVDALSEQVSQSVAEGRLVEVLQLAHAIREGLSAGATLNTDDLYDDQGLPR